MNWKGINTMINKLQTQFSTLKSSQIKPKCFLIKLTKFLGKFFTQIVLLKFIDKLDFLGSKHSFFFIKYWPQKKTLYTLNISILIESQFFCKKCIFDAYKIFKTLKYFFFLTIFAMTKVKSDLFLLFKIINFIKGVL